jgi:hypothetical protein
MRQRIDQAFDELRVAVAAADQSNNAAHLEIGPPSKWRDDRFDVQRFLCGAASKPADARVSEWDSPFDAIEWAATQWLWFSPDPVIARQTQCSEM